MTSSSVSSSVVVVVVVVVVAVVAAVVVIAVVAGGSVVDGFSVIDVVGVRRLLLLCFPARACSAASASWAE